MRKAAELGFTSVDIPEEYGGLGMDKITSTLITDHLSVLASFSTAFGAHIGIATLPLVWYGTEEQKQRYLPKLATAEWIGAYALSEATSGSDAMNIRTRATLSADGSTYYVLNGEKMWITNCGIAGLYTVFAKIDGEKFSAFLDRARHSRPDRRRRGAQAGHSRLVHLPARAAGLQGSGREPAWRAGQGPPHRLQRAERGPLQARRGLRGRSAPRAGAHDSLRQGAQGLRQVDRRVRPDPAQDLRRAPRASTPPKAWPTARSA